MVSVAPAPGFTVYPPSRGGYSPVPLPHVTPHPGPVDRMVDVTGPFAFGAVPWLAGTCVVLVALLCVAMVREYRYRAGIVVAYGVGWAWLVVTVMVLHHTHDPNAETAGWLLFGVAVLTALPTFLAAAGPWWVPLALVVMTFAALGVGAVATGQSGSPEDIHHDEPGHVRPVDAPVPRGR